MTSARPRKSRSHRPAQPRRFLLRTGPAPHTALSTKASHRMHDAIILGGSYAGISAGLQLARARRDVLILDAGQRRNRRGTASHGFLGQDGKDAGAIAAKGRAELLAYPTVTGQDAAVIDAWPVPD